MSITATKIWPKLKKYVRIEKYKPDGGYAKPRIRIEINALPAGLKTWALITEMPCVACGAKINPIRSRRIGGRPHASGHLYYAPTCPLSKNVGCSRGAKAHEEYDHIRELLS